jgi:hypothetical protein
MRPISQVFAALCAGGAYVRSFFEFRSKSGNWGRSGSIEARIRSLNRSPGREFRRAVYRSAGRFTGRPAGLQVGRPVYRSAGRPVHGRCPAAMVERAICPVGRARGARRRGHRGWPRRLGARSALAVAAAAPAIGQRACPPSRRADSRSRSASSRLPPAPSPRPPAPSSSPSPPSGSPVEGAFQIDRADAVSSMVRASGRCVRESSQPFG